jgi:hypothetical protein
MAQLLFALYVGIESIRGGVPFLFPIAFLPPFVFRIACRRPVRSALWILTAHYVALFVFEARADPGLAVLLFAIVACGIVGLVRLERQPQKPFPLWIWR